MILIQTSKTKNNPPKIYPHFNNLVAIMRLIPRLFQLGVILLKKSMDMLDYKK